MSDSANNEHHQHRLETKEMNHLYKTQENAATLVCI